MTPEEEALVEELGSFATDPYAFVLWAFPWGEPGTELERFPHGPDGWQKELLCRVRDKLLTPHEAILEAVASGHGVGKSALVAWLVWWAFSTCPNTRGVVTANTETQLKTKTWVEIAKWHRLFIARQLFKCTATALFTQDESLKREWRIDIVPWSERNTEAFAGLHNQGSRIIIVFDEASAIPDVIFEVTEGALTDKDTEIMWFCFGNPTRSTGRFRDCFPGGAFAARWSTCEVDSRSVRITNKEQIARWIEDYGLDSDFVRVRVLGKFPRQDLNSFISRELATEASLRIVAGQEHAALILGVDVARYGGNLSALVPRRGRDARSIPPRFFSNISLSMLAHHIGAFFNEIDADAIMVDGTGVGGGVVDILSDLNYPVYEIQFGARAPGFHDGQKYANWRAEMWGLLRDALPTLAILDRPPGYEGSLVEELIGPGYVVNEAGAIKLESKESMIRRGVQSPDYADALALTYAYPIAARGFIPTTPQKPYNPYDPERMYAHLNSKVA